MVSCTSSVRHGPFFHHFCKDAISLVGDESHAGCSSRIMLVVYVTCVNAFEPTVTARNDVFLELY